jgi:hypothetical protein
MKYVNWLVEQKVFHNSLVNNPIFILLLNNRLNLIKPKQYGGNKF